MLAIQCNWLADCSIPGPAPLDWYLAASAPPTRCNLLLLKRNNGNSAESQLFHRKVAVACLEVARLCYGSLQFPQVKKGTFREPTDQFAEACQNFVCKISQTEIEPQKEHKFVSLK